MLIPQWHWSCGHLEVVDDILDFIATEEVPQRSGRSDGEFCGHDMWDVVELGTFKPFQTLDDFPTWT